MRAARYSRRQMRSGPLVLVNRQHPLAEEPRQAADSDGRAVSQYPAGAAGRPAAGRLHPGSRRGAGDRAGLRLAQSGGATRPFGRTPCKRRGEAFTRQYVAVPGCGEHQTGLAIDLGRAAREIDFIRPDFPEEGACGRFRRLAPRYGFIQRYHRERSP